jgi:TonB family protein
MSSHPEVSPRVSPRAVRGIVLLCALAAPCTAAAQEAGEGAVPRGPGSAIVTPPEQEAPAPAAPQVVLPKQTKFVDAPYPPEAQAAGLQAEVPLLLDIDKTGKVTNVTVTAPQGHGFDEAAQAAALQFEFEPATRDGKPLAVRLPYKYRFTLQVVEKVVEPAKPPTVGNLGGQIQIQGPDMPLVGVEVVVVGADGAERRATTDGEGRFVLEGLPPGKYVIKVKPDGFQPFEGTEDVAAGEATDITYRVAPVSEGVEVTVRGERPPREVTRRTIERREMMRIPGTSGDALRSIQSLPGVARPPGIAGLLIVRGAAPEDTAYFMDGAAIPLVYHFGGLSSVVPTELLDRIDFYPGNFSVRYGEVMGGIVDIALREPYTQCTGDYGKKLDKDGCFHGLAQLDLIDARVLMQGQVGEWTFAVGGRRSWIDAWLKPVLEESGAGVTTAPVYYDYQAIVETKPSPTSRVSARFYGSDDRLKVLITDPFAQDPAFGGNLTFGTGFYRAQLLYEAELNRSVNMMAQVAVGKDAVDFALGPIKFNLNLTPISTRSEFGFKLFPGGKLNVGMDFNIAPYHVYVRAPAPPRPGEPDPGPFTTRQLQQTDQESTAFRPAWYADMELQPTRRTQLVPGIRLDYARDSGHSDVSPRFNGRYDIVGGRAEDGLPIEERRLRTTIKGGVGVFYQPPQFQETDPVFGTPGIESNRAIHYSIGVEQEFTRQIELSVEGYYKDLGNLVSRSASLDSSFAYGNEGTGSSYGVETLLKYKPDSRFFGWLAYTLSRSVRTDSPDQPEHLFQFDQTHNLTVLGSYRLGRGWEFGARFRVISGNLDTPVLQPPGLPALYAADAAAYAPLQGEPFSTRLPLFHQLDVRVDKAWQFRTWRLSTYLDVQNVYNNPAKEGTAYNYNYTRHTYASGLPIIPSLGIRGEI